MTTTATSPFHWSDAFLLGYAPMDNTHQEFVEIVEAMLTAKDEDFASHINAFVKHAERHFEEERAWMVDTGFPAMQCHVDEHDAVLKSVLEVRDLIAGGGDAAVGRSLANELARWFPGHADYMDASLAQWMSKKRFGGTPVVLRRGVAVGEDEA
jgi:hemerythrin